MSTLKVFEAFSGYGRGKARLLTIMNEQIGRLRDAGLAVFILCHIKNKEKTDLMSGEKYEQITNNLTDATTNDLQNQINKLVLGAVGDGNNAEVVQARGTCATLNDRISPIESGFLNNKQNIYNILAMENIVATSMVADGLNNTIEWDVARGIFLLLEHHIPLCKKCG